MYDSVDEPGRGAWTERGGLLPVKPGTTKKGFYYRSPYPNETMIGRPYKTLARTGPGAFTRLVIWETVRVIQRIVGVPDDGLLGDQTGAAIARFQRMVGLKPDALLGPETAKAMLLPFITRAAGPREVPVNLVGGIAAHESRLDIGAVGPSGWDVGPCQINLSAPAALKVTVAQAVDPQFAFAWTASELQGAYARWAKHPKVIEHDTNPWDIAVANHNSPRAAQEWALSGTPPWSPERDRLGYPQIDEYVASVRAAWKE